MAHLDPVQPLATPPVVITLGDALGIGPEIIVRAFLDGRTGPPGQTLVLGEPAVLRRAAAVWRQRADVPELPIAVIDSVADPVKSKLSASSTPKICAMDSREFSTAPLALRPAQ